MPVLPFELRTEEERSGEMTDVGRYGIHYAYGKAMVEHGIEGEEDWAARLSKFSDETIVDYWAGVDEIAARRAGNIAINIVRNDKDL